MTSAFIDGPGRDPGASFDDLDAIDGLDEGVDDGLDEGVDAVEVDAWAGEDDADVDAWDEGGDLAVDDDVGADLDEFYAAVESSFAESMDAADDDEFMARVRGNLSVHGTLHITPMGGGPPHPHPHRRPHPHPQPHRRRPSGGGGHAAPPTPAHQLPLWRRLALEALPAASRVVRTAAGAGGAALGSALGRRAGGALLGELGPVGAAVGSWGGGLLGGLGGRALGNWGGGRLTSWAEPRLRRWLQDGMDAMDAFADIAAENMDSESDLHEFAPVMSGLAGRFVVREALTPAERHASRRPTQELGRQVMRATERATEIIVRRYGRRAIRSVPRIVRRVLREVARSGRPVTAVPALIERGARTVAARPAMAQQLSRPSASARRLRAAAGVQPGRRLPMRRGQRNRS